MLVLTAAGVAYGHHSTAIFDQSKEFTIEGTVVSWRMIRPHAQLTVEAEGPDGEMQIYQLDFGNGDRILQAYDLHEPDSFRPGDWLRVTGAPSRFGDDPRMLVSSMRLPDGRLADGGSHSGARQGDGQRTGPPLAVDPSITLPVIEVTGELTALEWTDPEIVMTITGTQKGSDEVMVYTVRGGGATSLEQRQYFAPEDFPIGGQVSTHGYFIPEEGNLIYPLNIWTATRDMYNQPNAINSARGYLGWEPMQWEQVQQNFSGMGMGMGSPPRPE